MHTFLCCCVPSEALRFFSLTYFSCFAPFCFFVPLLICVEYGDGVLQWILSLARNMHAFQKRNKRKKEKKYILASAIKHVRDDGARVNAKYKQYARLNGWSSERQLSKMPSCVHRSHQRVRVDTEKRARERANFWLADKDGKNEKNEEAVSRVSRKIIYDEREWEKKRETERCVFGFHLAPYPSQSAREEST